MEIANWAKQSAGRIRRDGIEGVRESLRPVHHKALSQLCRFQAPGTLIYELDWDLLIIVDACRLDLMEEVAGEYEFIDSVDSVRSVDSTTAFWMRKNFTEEFREEMSDTAYVCGNPFSEQELSTADFHTLEEVWRYAWDDPGTVPPRAVTDRAVHNGRTTDASRFIVHYMQPHCPFIPRPELSRGKRLDRFGNQSWRDVWERLRDGEISYEDVWEGYRLNLELVLDEVELLLANVDAERAVVSSDHGNAVGEWGVYGHPPNQPHDCLRVVPWIESAAVDSGEYEPRFISEGGVEESTKRQLKSLGYV